MKYPIRQQFLTAPSSRRSGRKADTIRFLVAHDTGNEGSTARANVNYYERSRNEMSASAHIFVDGLEIIECIPAFKDAEKAWHVRYDVTQDNSRFGREANDCSIGVELCYGGDVNTREAYKKYVWVLAYLCHYYNLEPNQDIAGHFELDPKRKTDPVNALKTINKTFDDLLLDVRYELEICRMGDEPLMEEIIKRIESLEQKNNMDCPSWARSATDKAIKAGLIESTNNGNGRSLDVYTMLVILDRKKLI
jgi:hypothetical protein